MKVVHSPNIMFGYLYIGIPVFAPACTTALYKHVSPRPVASHLPDIPEHLPNGYFAPVMRIINDAIANSAFVSSYCSTTPKPNLARDGVRPYIHMSSCLCPTKFKLQPNPTKLNCCLGQSNQSKLNYFFFNVKVKWTVFRN